MVKVSSSTNKKSKSIPNPFKEEDPGWLHYGIIFTISILVLTSFLASTDQGKSDVQDFHQKHIARHLERLRQHRQHQHHHPHQQQQQQQQHSQQQQHRQTAEGHHAHMHKRDGDASENHEHGQADHHEHIHHEEHVEEEEEESGEGDDDDDESKEDEDEPDWEGFPEIEQKDYGHWMHKYFEGLKWEFGESSKTKKKAALTRPTLQKSLELGCQNMMRNQRHEGNFNYQYDFVSQEMDQDDSQVRQAGALWGLALCFQQMPANNELKAAVNKGLDFFFEHSVAGPKEGTYVIHYPGAEDSDTGTNALLGLTLIDYLRTVHDNRITLPSDRMNELNERLHGVIEFLLYQQKDDLHFSAGYNLEEETKKQRHNPYYDGETLLCLTKAAKYLGDDYKSKLVPILEAAAPVLAKTYTLDSWRMDQHDSDWTKGFYQWSSMAFAEYYDAGWKDSETLFGDYVLSLAHWIIHTHRILHRTRNTGYAYEGLVAAYRVAATRGSRLIQKALRVAIEEGLHKIASWQVGGPWAKENRFLQKHRTVDPLAVGGVMNAQNEAPLRIDTTQHQMHAIMMALESLYPDGDNNHHR